MREFPLIEVLNGLIHKPKDFERTLFQMRMEIERVKISRSSGNHGTVTEPALASSRGNFIEDSKEETEILAEAPRCCVLKNMANPIEMGQTYMQLPLKSWNIPLKVARFFSLRSTFSVLNLSQRQISHKLYAPLTRQLSEECDPHERSGCARNRPSGFATEIPKQCRIHEARD
jgi:hypothetical protein